MVIFNNQTVSKLEGTVNSIISKAADGNIIVIIHGPLIDTSGRNYFLSVTTTGQAEKD
jgi:hypothetical protein